MDTIICKDYHELTAKFIESYRKRADYGTVDIIGKFNEVKEVIIDLIKADFDIASIEIENQMFKEDYDREYILALDSEGIWCEEAKNKNNEYKIVISDVVFISNEINSKAIKQLNADHIFAFEIDEDKSLSLSQDKESANTQYVEHYINGEKVSKQKYDEEIAKTKEKFAEFDSIFRKHVLSMCEMMDEINDWRKLLY